MLLWLLPLVGVYTSVEKRFWLYASINKSMISNITVRRGKLVSSEKITFLLERHIERFYKYQYKSDYRLCIRSSVLNWFVCVTKQHQVSQTKKLLDLSKRWDKKIVKLSSFNYRLNLIIEMIDLIFLISAECHIYSLEVLVWFKIHLLIEEDWNEIQTRNFCVSCPLLLWHNVPCLYTEINEMTDSKTKRC